MREKVPRNANDRLKNSYRKAVGISIFIVAIFYALIGVLWPTQTIDFDGFPDKPYRSFRGLDVVNVAEEEPVQVVQEQQFKEEQQEEVSQDEPEPAPDQEASAADESISPDLDDLKNITAEDIAKPPKMKLKPMPPPKPIFNVVTKPRLKNRQEVVERLDEIYPRHLVDAGIDGVVMLRIFINETGNITDVKIARSSGIRELDEAAMKIKDFAQFHPAVAGYKFVSMWIVMPVRFQVR